jgi:hypothetical protein
MRKTKIHTRASRPVAKFTVRRIANKNPRSARSFHQFKRKLSRATAGLLLFGLFASGMAVGDGSTLKSEIMANSENSQCAATEITANLEDITSKSINLNRGFPKLFDNLKFCDNESCAAEKKIYQSEEQIWQLRNELAELKNTESSARTKFEAQLSELEDGVLFCENEERCDIAESALRTARVCEKEFQKINQILETKQSVEDQYTLLNSKGKKYPALFYTEKLMEDIFKNRARVDSNESAYLECVAADDASVCQEYIQNKKEAENKITASIEELSSLKYDLENNLTKIDADLTALQIGKKDVENLTAEEGKGWCEAELEEKKVALSEKVTQAKGFKKTYDAALKKLKAKKAELAERIDVEIEAANMHAAAERAAVEKRGKAETIFGIWSAIRNTF